VRRQAWGLWALGAAVLLLAALPVPEFWITQLNYIGLSGLAVLGLILLTGIGGLTSFGQAAFVGIGAYTSAWLTVHTGLSPWLTLFIGVGLTAISAVALGWLTLRMSGHYLPLATLAWGLSLYYLMGNLDALGKYDGILDVPGLSLLGWQLGQGRVFFVLTWGMVLLSALGMLRLLDSRVGRAMRALKNGSQMAESMGIERCGSRSASSSCLPCWPACQAGCMHIFNAR
jgi:branched-chain amino acid transport system permease protein